MTDGQMILICILVGLLSLAIVGIIAWLGFAVFRINIIDRSFQRPYLALFHRWMVKGQPPHYDIPRHLAESYSEYLQRRNEFWNTYGQVLMAIFIVTVITILLLTKAISAEVGLPILSGVSGFAIAKGVTGAKATSAPQERQ